MSTALTDPPQGPPSGSVHVRSKCRRLYDTLPPCRELPAQGSGLRVAGLPPEGGCHIEVIEVGWPEPATPAVPHELPALA